MGEMADYYMEQTWGAEDWGFGAYDLGYSGTVTGRRRGKNFQSGVGNYCWRTKDRGVVRMDDMTSRHLENAIGVCELTGNTGKRAQLMEVLVRKQREELDAAEELLFHEPWEADYSSLEDRITAWNSASAQADHFPPGHPMEML